MLQILYWWLVVGVVGGWQYFAAKLIADAVGFVCCATRLQGESCRQSDAPKTPTVHTCQFRASL